MLNKFTPQFKALVVFLLFVVAFGLIFLNELHMKNELNQAEQNAQAAVNIASSAFAKLSASVTPTATPSASPTVVPFRVRAATESTPVPTVKK